MSASVNFNSWRAETHCELLRVLRSPAYFVPMLLLPTLFFVMFGVAMAPGGGSPEYARYFYVSYGAFGTLMSTVLGLAASIAVERERGLLLLKRALPLPAGAYVGAKIIAMLLIAATVNAWLALLAGTIGHVQQPAQQWLLVWLANVLGGLPLAAMGIWIGSWVSASAAPGIANLINLPMSFLCGLWIPLKSLPPIIGKIAVFLPGYHFVQLPLSVVGAGDGSAAWPHVLVLIAFTVVFFTLAKRRLATEGSAPVGFSRIRKLALMALVAIAIGVGVQFMHSPSPAQPAVPLLTPADRNSFAVRNVRVFDGVQILEHQTVIVRDGRIAALAADAVIPDGLPVVEGKDRTLLPGLIDAHTHSYGSARHEALRFGVTTELEMFGDWHALKAAREQRESLSKTDEADLWSSGTLATVPKGHGTEYGIAIPTLTMPAEAEAFVAARQAEQSDYLKVVVEDGSAFGKQLPTLDQPTLAALAAAARAHGLMSLAHIGTEADASRAIEAGIDGLAHVFLDQPADAAFIALAKQHRSFMIATLSVTASAAGAGEGAKLASDVRLSALLSGAQGAALKASFPKDWQNAKFLPNGLDSVRQLNAAGIRILAGTDAGNPGTAHGASLHGELALLVQAGLTPLQALTAATSLPAEIFKLGDRGRIAPGLRADLLLVDGDPANDITATRAIVGIWKNGYAVDRTLKAGEAAGETGAKAPSDPLIADFDAGAIAVRFGRNWQITTDTIVNGESTASQQWLKLDSGGALAVQGEIRGSLPYAWAGTMMMVGDADMSPVDFSGRHTVVFRVRGDGREDSAMLFSGSDARSRPSILRFNTTTAWQEVRLPLKDFVGADLTRLRALAFTAAPPAGAFHFEIDQVSIE